MIEFGILGSLEAQSGGRLLPVAGHREQCVLAVLVLDAGRVVPLRRLIDAVWDDPPDTAGKQVMNAVSRLRQVLRGAGGGNLIAKAAGGYRLAADRCAVDARVFQAGVGAARLAASEGKLAEAAGLLRSALALWRGPALAGLTGREIESAAAGWEERRVAAQETCLGLELALGRHRDVLGELAGLAAGHPLRENLAGQYMLALYRCGRQADALAVYTATRELLAGQLGLDPGPELQVLHQQILTADPALAPPGTAPIAGERADADAQVAMAGGAATAAPMPRQLPGATPYFVGRAGALAELDRVAGEGGGPGAVVISAIGGMAGVGKTALAVHYAHQAAARFPDGQLYVNLHGFDPSGRPVPPEAAIRGFLDALGAPAARIPPDLDGQAALYRSMLAGRRMLILADNARDPAQVRPLLPAAPGCLVLVTSRHQLTGLAAADGARLVSLDVLDQGEARRLLEDRLGEDRVAAEPGPAADLITLCGRLPLALAIAAARAAARPSIPLSALAAELRDAPLDALDTGDDPAADARAAFSWSYRALTPQAARLFRLLGLHPGPDISAPAAASLAGRPPTQARRLIAELTSAHLISEHAPGRYALHDLLHAYATELASQPGNDSERNAAVSRLLDHYVHAAHIADRPRDTFQDQASLDPPGPGVTPEEPASDTQALAWFTAERPVLLAAVDLAASAGHDARAYQLAWALEVFLDRHGHWQELAAVQQAALAAARRLADPRAQAFAHRALGHTYARMHQLSDAHAHLQDALDLYRQAGDQAGQARIHCHLSHVRGQQGHLAAALKHARKALSLYRAIGHIAGQAAALNNIGWAYFGLGDHKRAQAHCQQALPLFQQAGNADGQATTWDSLAQAHHQLGEYDQAAACYQHALALCNTDRSFYAHTLARLGDTRHAAGDHDAARDAWQQALPVLDDIDHPDADKVRAKLATLHP